MQLLKNAAVALLAGMALAACSDDVETVTPPVTPPAGKSGAYVINQGSWGVVDGSVDYLSPEWMATPSADKPTASDYFATVNGQSLGDTPQRGMAYGSKLYLPVTASNLVWVVDKATLKIITSFSTNEPEAVCAANGKLFVTNNDGFVTAVDTTAFNVLWHTEVGPNPVEMACLDSRLYVAVSDGWNSANNYANGKKLAVVDTKTGAVAEEIGVGLNPTRVVAHEESGRLYVVCMGNYGDVPSAVYVVEAAGKTAEKLCDGTLVALNGNRLYVVNGVTDWGTGTTSVTAAVYDAPTQTLLSDNFFAGADAPPAPTGIDINPATGEVYVCSRQSAMSYTAPGLLLRYATDGSLVSRCTTGVEPYGVVFF